MNEKELREIISKRVVELRNIKGWKQEVLADRIGVSRSSLGHKEKAGVAWSVYEVCRIAEEGDVSVLWLLGVDEESLTKDETKILQAFRLLDESAQKEAIIFMQGLGLEACKLQLGK